MSIEELATLLGQQIADAEQRARDLIAARVEAVVSAAESTGDIHPADARDLRRAIGGAR